MESTTEVQLRNFRYFSRTDFGFTTHMAVEIENKLMKRYTDPQWIPYFWLGTKYGPLEESSLEFAINKKGTLGLWNNIKFRKDGIFARGRPVRILIRSHSAEDENYLVTTLLTDWVKGEPYIKSLFGFVFVISLENFKETVESTLLQQCEGVDGSDEEILEAIRTVNTLILVTGYETALDGAFERIFPLLSRQQFKHKWVVMICRNRDPPEELFNFDFRGRHKISWDKRIHMKVHKIYPHTKVDLMKKFLNPEINQFLGQNLSYGGNPFNSPLLPLHLATSLYKEEIINTNIKTEYYKAVLNHVINKSLEKQGILAGKAEVNFFDENYEDKLGCRNLLIELGRLCVRKLKEQNFKFDESELLLCAGENMDKEIIFKLGFFSKKFSFLNCEDKDYYELIHESLVDFFAAFYFASLSETDLGKEIRGLCLEFDIWPKKDLLLYPFLGGILHLNAFKLFNALYPFRNVISLFSVQKSPLRKTLSNMEDILMEIPQTDENLKTLSNFSPGYWTMVDYKDSLREWFVHFFRIFHNESTREQITLTIPKYLDFLIHLPEHVTVNQILVQMEGIFYKIDENWLNDKIIKCDHLLIISAGIDAKFLLTLKLLLSRIKPKKLWIDIAYDSLLSMRNFYPTEFNRQRNNFIDLYMEIITGNLHVTFYHLTMNNIPSTLFQLISSHIKDLIVRKKVEFGINIVFACENINQEINIDLQWNSFMEVAVNSHLKSFGCSGSNYFPIDLKFTNNQKHWKYIHVKGLFTVMNNRELETLSVEQFYCGELTLKENDLLPILIMKCKNIKRLSCHYNLLSDLSLCYSVSEWNCLESFEHLDLFGLISEVEAFLEVISLFKNLKVIYFYDLKESDFPIQVLSSLPSSLKKISFRPHFDLFPMDFLEKLLTLKDDKKEINLDELNVGCLTEKDLIPVSFVLTLERCFSENIFVKFSFFNTRSRINDLLKHFLSKEKFQVIIELEEELFNDEMQLPVGFPYLMEKISICYENNEPSL